MGDGRSSNYGSYVDGNDDALLRNVSWYLDSSSYGYANVHVHSLVSVHVLENV